MTMRLFAVEPHHFRIASRADGFPPNRFTQHIALGKRRAGGCWARDFPPVLNRGPDAARTRKFFPRVSFPIDHSP